MKRDTTPRGQLMAALTAAGARCLAQINVTKKENVRPYNLEFWSVPTPKPGRLVLIQFWEEGGWDAYVPIKESKTELAIKELIEGNPLADKVAGIAFSPSNNGERWDEGYRSGWNAALNAAFEVVKAG